MFLVFYNVMKKFILLLSLIPYVLLAQTIGVEDAQNKALQFLQRHSQTRASQREVQLKLAYTSKSGDETYYYVFNNADGGYVIMGGDEAAKEVLGYGETGSFDYARIPDNMRWWLGQYDAQISQAIREVKAGTNKVVRQTQTRSERAEIPVMLTTTWGQLKPYNMQLPTSQSGVADLPVGCTITAFSQIMNYHRWPDTGSGSNTLETEYFVHKFTADFENTHYDWEAMADSYDTIYSGTREEVAVGTLMYHLGVAFKAVYSNSATIANFHDAAKGLAEHFRYNKGMINLLRSYYNDTEWEKIVYDELNAKRPVLYSGYTEKNEGHAFVCDGYKDGHWHINWGWNGKYNNYFLITPTSTEKALQPGGTGTGGGAENDSYAINQEIVIGIYPDSDGNTLYKPNLNCYKQVINQKLVAGGDSVTLSTEFNNLSLNTEKFEIRYKLVNVDNADDFFLLDDIFLLISNNLLYQRIETAICIPDGVRQGASYYVIPMFKNEKGEWQQTLQYLSSDFASLRIGKEFEVTQQLVVDNSSNACKDYFVATFKIRNFTDSTLTCPMLINVYPADDENAEPVDYFDLGNITLASREERLIRVEAKDLHYGDRMVVGKVYKLQLISSTDKTTFGRPVKFSYVDSRTISLTVPEMGWTTFAIPFDAEIPEGLKAYRVDFSNNNDSVVLERQDRFLQNCAYLIHGVPGTYQFIGPDLDLNRAQLGKLYNTDYTIPLSIGWSYILDLRDGVLGFYKVNDTTYINQYEAYILSYYSAEMFAIIYPDDDKPTSLQQIITPGTPIDSRIYDLNGRIISADHKGIVIRDGKVFIMKE